MTPTLPNVLIGQAIALSSPQPPEAGGDYLVNRLGLVAMLATLAAQEAERGPAARIWENEAMRALFQKVAADYDDALDGGLTAVLALPDAYTWSGMDAVNAELRRALIDLHEAAEMRWDRALDAEILQLYQGMAQARRLDLPGALA